MKIFDLISDKEILVGSGANLYQIAQENGYKDAVAAIMNGNLTGLNTIPSDNSTVKFLTFNDKMGKKVYWHSASHIMAQAVKRLFKDVKVAIGPAIENGFYYDFDIVKPFTPDDLSQIEEEILKIIKEDIPIIREEKSKKDALDFFSKTGEIYKVELIQDLEDGTISFYSQGDFIDLCRGPHLISTGKVGAIKLLSTAGAYWRGDEKNKMLQRIYGIAFPNKKELKRYLVQLEEAKKRDHRKLGKELDLFSIHDEAGAGLIYWHPKGAFIRKQIEDFWKNKHLENGYELVYTPHIAKSDLWKTSGHLDFFAESMYSPMQVDNYDYFIKPMNCPFHILIYKTQIRSYRQLPIRWAELGTVYRYEKSGVLHGLMRVRGFTQDDAHIFCTLEQLEEEAITIIDFITMMLNAFGFTDFDVYLSTKPEKSVGSDENWKSATDALVNALRKLNISYDLDEGGGAFYGPKIDIKIRDSIGRTWQCSTVQIDFNEPERFNVEYIDDKGKGIKPIMIHRALLGSLERFFGILIEHYGGAFPVWLTPEQVRIITVSADSITYAKKVYDELLNNGIRVKCDFSNEKMGYKIRNSQIEKIPYSVIIEPK